MGSIYITFNLLKYKYFKNPDFTFFYFNFKNWLLD